MQNRENPNKIRSEKGDVTTNIAEIDNPEEMDKFLETQSPTKLNQEEIDNLNRMITRSERTCN